MNNMSPEVALHRISPELRPLLCSVVRNGRVGLDATNFLRVTDLKTGCTTLTPGPCCDRFKLHIPYAGETLKWDIIFNARYPELPPDFIFGEDAEFIPEPSELPTAGATPESGTPRTTASSSLVVPGLRGGGEARPGAVCFTKMAHGRRTQLCGWFHRAAATLLSTGLFLPQPTTEKLNFPVCVRVWEAGG
ncbi:unnamed protein product [Boreogadus saida]